MVCLVMGSLPSVSASGLAGCATGWDLSNVALSEFYTLCYLLESCNHGFGVGWYASLALNLHSSRVYLGKSLKSLWITYMCQNILHIGRDVCGFES